MALVTYPIPESAAERKAREKEGTPMRFFSFTVIGTNADERDQKVAPKAMETMREILGRSRVDSRAVESNRVASGVRQTSRNAYSRAKVSGQLSAQQQQVLAAFDGRDYTRQELAKKTGLGINCIAGRVRELLDIGELREVGRRECSITHESVTTLRRVAMEIAA